MFQSYTEKVYRTEPKPRPPVCSTEMHLFCNLCEDSEQTAWYSETDLEMHRKDVHFDYIKRQMSTYAERFCTICMRLQDSRNALICHIKTRHLLSTLSSQRVERKIFICEYCDHIFFNKEVLEVHLMYLHCSTPSERRFKTFQCPKCNKICQMKSLWYHLQYHQIPSLTVCDICLTHYPTSAELMTHVKEHPMYYKCEICNFQTTKDHLYETHIVGHIQKSFDKDSMPGYRKKMMKSLFRKDYLNVLKYNIHHAFKGLILPKFMHICILCREICTSKSEMMNHILRDHTDTVKLVSKPTLKCSCGTQFQNRVLLKHHIFKLKGTHRDATDDAVSEDAAQPQEDLMINSEESDIVEIELTTEAEGEDVVAENNEIIYTTIYSTEDETLHVEHNEEVVGF